MNIDEAIQILQNDLENETLDDPIDLHAAEKLAIEALKWVRSRYDPDHQMMKGRLPGEDPE